MGAVMCRGSKQSGRNKTGGGEEIWRACPCKDDYCRTTSQAEEKYTQSAEEVRAGDESTPQRKRTMEAQHILDGSRSKEAEMKLRTTESKHKRACEKVTP
eukprot:2359768-Amphidinium_carterae.1